MTAPEIENRKTEKIDKICSLGLTLILLRFTIRSNIKNAVAKTTPSKFANIAAFCESEANAKVTNVFINERDTITGSNGNLEILLETLSIIISSIVPT